MAKDLSILIPARNEMFLAKTVEDILSNIEADTEVIVVLDGQWSNPPLKQHPKLTVVFVPVSIGQRAATNLACRLSRAKYVMKVDAHCAFDKGFDRKLIEDMQDDWTVAPTMRNLYVFDWVCRKCGNRWYQSPTPDCCYIESADRKKKVKNTSCDSKEFFRDVVWKAKKKPQSNSFCFDSKPHFQYFNEYPHRHGDLTESMSLQGSCFMLTREKYWELNISDESFGSWGNQGIEVAGKTWLSGGRVIINHKTWYAHLFRTQGGDFGFPYVQDEANVGQAKAKVWDLFFSGWDKQVHPMSWLIKKFWPVKGWTQEDLNNLHKKESNSKHHGK